MAGFIVRLVGYVALFGIVMRVALVWWSQFGLDGVAVLQPLHDDGIGTLLIAPVVLALIGFGPLRLPAVFVGFFLAGAALTAPFVCARALGV
jgi:hypothetical protein